MQWSLMSIDFDRRHTMPKESMMPQASTPVGGGIQQSQPIDRSKDFRVGYNQDGTCFVYHRTGPRPEQFKMLKDGFKDREAARAYLADLQHEPDDMPLQNKKGGKK